MKIYGLFGEKLSHSLSPDLHKAIYQKAQIEAGYKLFPFPPSRVEEAVKAIRLLSINGVNVTIPYKESVIPFLDHLSSDAELLKVVNTIQNKNGTLIGYNTDYDGFGLIFRRRDWLVNNRSFVILGTGGASKMAITYLKNHGARKITVVSRKERPKSPDSEISYTTYNKLTDIKADYLINTTPVGMYPDVSSSPLSEGDILGFDRVIDLIYNPGKTQLLSFAEKRGKPIANGLDMLIGQAVRSVEIWEEITLSNNLVEELIQEFKQ